MPIDLNQTERRLKHKKQFRKKGEKLFKEEKERYFKKENYFYYNKLKYTIKNYKSKLSNYKRENNIVKPKSKLKFKKIEILVKIYLIFLKTR